MIAVNKESFSIQRLVWLIISLLFVLFTLIIAGQSYQNNLLESLTNQANNYHLKAANISSKALLNLEILERHLHEEMHTKASIKKELKRNIRTYWQLFKEDTETLLLIESEQETNNNQPLVKRLDYQWHDISTEINRTLNSSADSHQNITDKTTDIKLTLNQYLRQQQIAYDERSHEIGIVQQQSRLFLLFVIIATLVIGVPLIYRMIILINQSVSYRLTTEKKLKFHKESLEKLVTERTRALNRAQEIAEMGNWQWDTNLPHMFWSDELYQLFGFNPDLTEPNFTNLLSCISEIDKEDFINTINTAKQFGKAHLDLRITHQNGSLNWISTNLTAEKITNEQYAIEATVQNITNRKLNEESLLKAKEEAEAANRSKDTFLSRMSHELRTPLNAILGFAQLLEMDTNTPLTANQQSSTKEILQAGEHLLRLINELLDLERIKSGQFSISREPVALKPVIEDCIKLIEPMCHGNNITIISSIDKCDLIVNADITRLSQVFLNLLSNAVKYNTKDGRIIITCQKIDDRVEIEFKDDGKGLTEKEQQVLFTAFERLDADKDAIQGTGIGLSLSKMLVTLMHGDIGVRSQKGSGSEFWVRLPIVENQSLQSQPDKTDKTAIAEKTYSVVPEENSSSFTILCIEDNPANLRLLETVLNELNFINTLTSTAPGKGLELARKHKPDLILLDINLPDMNGFEVLDCLNANKDTSNIPVIAVSANAMKKDIEHGISAGFQDYVTKPIDVTQLTQTITRILNIK